MPGYTVSIKKLFSTLLNMIMPENITTTMHTALYKRAYHNSNCQHSVNAYLNVLMIDVMGRARSSQFQNGLMYGDDIG